MVETDPRTAQADLLAVEIPAMALMRKDIQICLRPATTSRGPCSRRSCAVRKSTSTDSSTSSLLDLGEALPGLNGVD